VTEWMNEQTNKPNQTKPSYVSKLCNYVNKNAWKYYIVRNLNYIWRHNLTQVKDMLDIAVTCPTLYVGEMLYNRW